MRLAQLSAVVVALGFFVEPAYAYLDPGTGSFVLQMLLASALAVGASIKLFWYRIREAFRRTVMGQGKTPIEPK
jgi:hypothetical protein